MIEKLKRTLGFIANHDLARLNKTRAVVSFVHWQLQTLFSPDKYFVKSFAGDLKVFVKKGQTGMSGNLYTGLHEFEDMAFLLHLLRGKDIFIDAGANVGSYTLLAAGITSARAYTFEPVPDTFKILKKNIELNQLTDKVVLFNRGLSSETGTLKFSALNDTTNHVVDDTLKDAVTVKVTTLDEELKEDVPVLIKIDVEGFETKVLKGAERLLANDGLKAIIIELNGSGKQYGFNDEDIHQNLLAIGFSPYSYTPFKRLLSLLSTYGKTNTIYIRDIAFAEERIQSSKPYRIAGVSF